MILPAFLAFVAATELADLTGPGHQWGGLALLTGWFFVCRSFGPRAWNRLLTAALALSVAIAALAVVQMWWLPRARGPFASPNFLGACAVLMFFLAVGSSTGRAGREAGNRGHLCSRFESWSAAANLISLVLSQSRGAILALGAGLLVMSASGGKWWKVSASVSVGAVAAVFLIRPGIDEARWGIWRIAWQAALQRPLTGWGQGGLIIGGLDRFYSIPLEVFVASGLVGAAAGAWLLCAAVRAAWTSPTLLAFLAAWFAQGLFLFSIPATNVLFVTVLALLSESHGGRESSSPHALSHER